MREPATSPALQILEAAYRLLAERGYARVSLRDIAEEAGVALSQLHYYYGGKEDLLVAVTRHFVRQSVGDLQRELAEIADAPGRAHRAIAWLQNRLVEDPGWIRLYFDLFDLALWNPTVASAARDLQAELVTAVLGGPPEQCRQFGACSPEAVARFVLAALSGLALQGLLAPGETSVADAYAILERVLRSDLLRGREP